MSIEAASGGRNRIGGLTLKTDSQINHFHIFAERLSSAIDALGAECAARSTIRDKRGYSL